MKPTSWRLQIRSDGDTSGDALMAGSSLFGGAALYGLARGRMVIGLRETPKAYRFRSRVVGVPHRGGASVNRKGSTPAEFYPAVIRATFELGSSIMAANGQKRATP